MDQSEVETEPRKKVQTLVWLILAALLVAAFASVVALMWRPDRLSLQKPGQSEPAEELARPAR